MRTCTLSFSLSSPLCVVLLYCSGCACTGDVHWMWTPDLLYAVRQKTGGPPVPNVQNQGRGRGTVLHRVVHGVYIHVATQLALSLLSPLLFQSSSACQVVAGLDVGWFRYVPPPVLRPVPSISPMRTWLFMCVLPFDACACGRGDACWAPLVMLSFFFVRNGYYMIFSAFLHVGIMRPRRGRV